MQFPWRDYIWVVILLGLAIGLAVELQRVRKLSVFREQAIGAEASARKLAEQIAAATDSQAQFGYYKHTPPSPLELANFVGFPRAYFVAKDGSQRTVRSVSIPHVWRTDEKNPFGSITGMTDLDMVLVMLPVALLVLRLNHQNAKRIEHKKSYSMKFFCIWGPIHILFMTAFCIFVYQGMSFLSAFEGKPFLGAFLLPPIILFTVRYIESCSLSEAGFARRIEETNGSLIHFHGTQQGFRFQLRDIFWLMLAIGLASTIFVEHRRGRDLMPYRGMAEWWSNATDALQTEYDEINAATGKGT